MESLYLVVRMAGQTVALAAAAVSSVVEIDAITPVPAAPLHIAGLFALRSRVMTVIDAQAALGYGAGDADAIRTGVVFAADGHHYALLVDDVDDVITAPAPRAVTARLGPGWAAVAAGTLQQDGREMLLVDPARLVASVLVA